MIRRDFFKAALAWLCAPLAGLRAKQPTMRDCFFCGKKKVDDDRPFTLPTRSGGRVVNACGPCLFGPHRDEFAAVFMSREAIPWEGLTGTRRGEALSREYVRRMRRRTGYNAEVVL